MNKICKIDNCGRLALPKALIVDQYSVNYDLNNALVILEKINSCWHHQ